jgi:hypothetical protein
MRDTSDQAIYVTLYHVSVGSGLNTPLLISFIGCTGKEKIGAKQELPFLLLTSSYMCTSAQTAILLSCTLKL